jgi:glycosyltransferase involved in cell wall biosynthesis
VSEPVFSLIMAAYNAADVIPAAIGSAQRQTLTDFELIVVDDGSTDGTGEIVAALAARDPRIRLLTQANAGANATRNRAISEARGRYVTFLDSDDLKLPGYLEAIAAGLEESPWAGLAYTDAYILDDETRRVHRMTFAGALGRAGADPPRDPLACLELLLDNCFIPFSATTLRRSVLEEIGSFDPRLAGTDDFELWMRVLSRGHGVLRVPGVLAVMRRRAGQISGDSAVMWTNLRDTYRVVAEEFPIPEPLRAKARAKADALEPRIAAARQAAARHAERGPAGRAAAAVWRWRMRLTWVRSWRIRTPGDLSRAFPDLRTS